MERNKPTYRRARRDEIVIVPAEDLTDMKKPVLHQDTHNALMQWAKSVGLPTTFES